MDQSNVADTAVQGRGNHGNVQPGGGSSIQRPANGSQKGRFVRYRVTVDTVSTVMCRFDKERRALLSALVQAASTRKSQTPKSDARTSGGHDVLAGLGWRIHDGTLVFRFSHPGDVVLFQSSAVSKALLRDGKVLLKVVASDPKTGVVQLRFTSAGVQAMTQQCLSRAPTKFRRRAQRLGLANLFVGMTPSGLFVGIRASTDFLAVEDSAVAKAIHYIRMHCGEPLRLDAVARHAGVSRSVLQRRFQTLSMQIRRMPLQKPHGE